MKLPLIKRNSGNKSKRIKRERADVLKISFTIAENQIAKSGDKVYMYK
jgi:hypothetical protein